MANVNSQPQARPRAERNYKGWDRHSMKAQACAFTQAKRSRMSVLAKGSRMSDYLPTRVLGGRTRMRGWTNE